MTTELIETRAESKPSFPSFPPTPFSFFPRVASAVPCWNGETYRNMLRCLISGSVVDGADLDRLRAGIAATLGVESVLLCGSGSLALELALRACEVGPGDEVVVPAFCCAAIVEPVLSVGAIPVLADAGDELNVTPETVAAALTRKTRAIVVPHLFGNPADIEVIVGLARGRNIRVIDDAAQALGATIDGRAVGSFGEAGILSFGREKVLFGLGGGALISREADRLANWSAGQLERPRLVPTLEKLATTVFAHRGRRWTVPLQRALAFPIVDDPAAPGSPYRRERIANLNAAVANSLFGSLDKNLSARRARARAYGDLLRSAAGVELIAHRRGSACLAQVARILPRRGRDLAAEIVAALARAGYEIHGSYVPIHLLGNYPQCVWDGLPHAERVWADLIELPCEPGVSLKDVERIAAIVKKLISG